MSSQVLCAIADRLNLVLSCFDISSLLNVVNTEEMNKLRHAYGNSPMPRRKHLILNYSDVFVVVLFTSRIFNRARRVRD